MKKLEEIANDCKRNTSALIQGEINCTKFSIFEENGSPVPCMIHIFGKAIDSSIGVYEQTVECIENNPYLQFHIRFIHQVYNFYHDEMEVSFQFKRSCFSF